MKEEREVWEIRYCPYCGMARSHSVSDTENSEMRYCPYCGVREKPQRHGCVR